MADLHDSAIEAQPQGDQDAARRKRLALASVGVLIVDVLGLLALAVIVPFLRGYAQDVTSFTARGVPGIIDFLVRTNGIDYALFLVLLAIIMVAKEIPIRDKKAALGVNIAVAVGGIVYAAAFAIAMHVPITMLLWDMRKVPSGASLNGSDAIPVSFWPASQKEHSITERKIIVSQYAARSASSTLTLETNLVTATFDMQDVIKYLETCVFSEPDKTLTERLRKESETRSRFRYSEFSGREGERMRYCIAHLLEQGKFIIGLKSNGQTVSRITVCKWSNVRGPLDGIGGRVFCLKDWRVFLWTLDWIS